MNILEYVLESLGWGGAGFIGGVLVGRAAQDVRIIADAVSTDTAAGITAANDTAHLPGDAMDQQQPGPRWKRVLTGAPTQVMVAVIVVLLGVITVVQGIGQADANRRVNACLSDYANKVAAALDARSGASTETQDSLDRLIQTVGMTLAGNADADRQVHQEITAYLAERAHLKSQQAAHPYPPAPRRVCG